MSAIMSDPLPAAGPALARLIRLHLARALVVTGHGLFRLGVRVGTPAMTHSSDEDRPALRSVDRQGA